MRGSKSARFLGCLQRQPVWTVTPNSPRLFEGWQQKHGISHLDSAFSVDKAVSNFRAFDSYKILTPQLLWEWHVGKVSPFSRHFHIWFWCMGSNERDQSTGGMLLLSPSHPPPHYPSHRADNFKHLLILISLSLTINSWCPKNQIIFNVQYCIYFHIILQGNKRWLIMSISLSLYD